ncbi:MAG TPA: ATP-dependent zinc metalloprotease FtsH [Ignavibacteriaceae bacterium]|nr:ATP-dependent zinc metalloprotease FtsH [Ignavibacteriaceae bacterium]
MNDGKQYKKQDKINRGIKPDSRMSQTAGWWKYILIFFLFWVAISYFFNLFNENSSTTLPYSTFKNQVRTGNVVSVTMKGNDISGKFKSKFHLPSQSGNDTVKFQYFTTTKPSLTDDELLKILEENNVTINAESQDNSWISFLLIMVLPWILILGYFFYVRRKLQGQMGNMMGGSGGGIFGVGKSRAKRFRRQKAGVTFDDVAGLESAKQDLREIIDYLKEPEKFAKLGADIPKGVLLMGPPGTGKTLLARATAGEADVTFYSISGSEFIEMFVGVGASRVRDLFENAKRESPAVIFIDEIDSVGRVRGTGLGGGHDEREQTLNQILSEMDGFERNESVVVLAATNRPDVLDPALTRPGRFDRRITLELPGKGSRKKILEIHTRHVPLGEDVDLENIAARTVSFSGADLKNLVNEAALLAGRKQKSKVEMEDFDEARDKILLGAELEEMINDEEKRVVAYHEAGHALVAKLLPNTDPLQKVTIIPRGRSLGATEQIPEIERFNLKKAYLLDRIAVALGGRAAEKLVFDDVTNGAAEDFRMVTRIARKMVCNWGMSERLGPVMYNQGEDHPFLGRELAQQKDFSEHTQQIIDEEIMKIVVEMEHKAESLIYDNRIKLDALAEALLENETLDKKQIDWILESISRNDSSVKPLRERRSKEKAN